MAIVNAGQAAREVVRLQADTATGGLTINLFWIIVAALNFLVFFAVLYLVVLKPIGVTLRERRARIEQGIHDADQARIERAAGEAAAVAELNAARRDARELLERAQKLAQESSAADIAATREELARMRERASAEIEPRNPRHCARLPGGRCQPGPGSRRPRRARDDEQLTGSATSVQAIPRRVGPSAGSAAAGLRRNGLHRRLPR